MKGSVRDLRVGLAFDNVLLVPSARIWNPGRRLTGGACWMALRSSFPTKKERMRGEAAHWGSGAQKEPFGCTPALWAEEEIGFMRMPSAGLKESLAQDFRKVV